MSSKDFLLQTRKNKRLFGNGLNIDKKDGSESTAFTDDKIRLFFVFYRVENIVAKQMFTGILSSSNNVSNPTPSIPCLLKLGIVW